MKLANKTEELFFPKKILYDDFLLLHPRKVIDLTGWYLNHEIFQLISSEFCNLESLILDDCLNINYPDLDTFRAKFCYIKRFSITSAIIMNENIAKVFGSWPNLTELCISKCTIEPNFFKILTQTCSQLIKLNCSACPNLDDFDLQLIGESISRHRKLSYIDLSKNRDFTDEGVLILISLGQFLLKFVNISGCRSLTSLALAGFRKKMPCLEYLDINNMLLNQSPFEWISEGCQSLTYLDVSSSNEINNTALKIIGSKCHMLKKINLSNCKLISNEGVVSFFSVFPGDLSFFDISGNILCTGPSLEAISNKSFYLESLKLNSLSGISSDAFDSLWSNIPNLIHFEMAVNLKSTVLHRQSMIPHISDAIVLKSKCPKLKVLKLTGAVLVTGIILVT